MMVSGYDKNPPPDRHESSFGWGGRLAIAAIVLLVGIFGFGHLFA